MITFMDKNAVEIVNPRDLGRHLNTEEFITTMLRVEVCFVRYEEDFNLAMKLLGTKRASGVAGKEVYTFVGDEARTLYANL